jgi:hypothetical protein
MNHLKLRTKTFAIALLALIQILAGATLPASAAGTFTAGSVSFSGVTRVDQVMTADPGTWSPTPDTITYQWMRDGSAIAGATGRTYTTQGEDFYTSLSVVVTATKAGYTTASRETGTLGIYTYSYFSNIVIPTISGSLRVGESIRAVIGSYPVSTTLSYKWYANGYEISGATSETYQLQPAERGKTMSVRVTSVKRGYWDDYQTSAVSLAVANAVPKVTWNANYSVLTGKNIFTAYATQAYKSTATINAWCFLIDGLALPLTEGPKGASFPVSPGSTSTTRTSTGAIGCFTSSSNLPYSSILLDVTKLTPGSHTLSAFVRDTDGFIGDTTNTTIVVAKTAPTFAGVYSSIPAVITDEFSFSGTTTTHAPSAPVRYICVSVDGSPISSVSSFTVTGQYGAAASANFVSGGTYAGCLSSTGANLAGVTVKLDSKQFSNGSHELSVYAMSADDDTYWISDTSRQTIKTKNKYIPTLTWSSAINRVTVIGAVSSIAGTISANIPGAPAKVTVSVADGFGGWKLLDTVENNNSFSAPARLDKNTKVQVLVFDEDGTQMLEEISTALVSPSIKLSTARVVTTGTTLSASKSKRVSYTVTAAKAQSASCTGKWSAGGGSGNVSFKINKGTGTVSFSPRNAAGTFSVVCSASGMTPNKAVVAKF